MSSIETSSIRIRPGSSFLLFLTAKDSKPNYAIKTTRELDVTCEKNTWRLKSSVQAFSSLEMECVSCRNNIPLDSNLFFRYSISFIRFFWRLQTFNVICNKSYFTICHYSIAANVALERSDIIWCVWEIKLSNYVQS